MKGTGFIKIEFEDEDEDEDEDDGNITDRRDSPTATLTCAKLQAQGVSPG
jgi:hypothetical protein